MVVEVDRAYTASANSPARVAAAARTAKEYWKLGWRPTTEAAVPLAWNPWHVESGLAEEGIIEAALKVKKQGKVVVPEIMIPLVEPQNIRNCADRAYK